MIKSKERSVDSLVAFYVLRFLCSNLIVYYSVFSDIRNFMMFYTEYKIACYFEKENVLLNCYWLVSNFSF